MKQFYVTEIVTKDKLQLAGMYAEPKVKNKKAILWMHGLSSAFYHEMTLFELLAAETEKQGWGFAHFNSRGHDVLAGIRKMDGTPPYGYSYYPSGAGAEVFEESVIDIDAGIDFLVAQGFTEIILVGHSTGANKVCYYAATQKNSHLAGVILSGPMSDRLSAPNSVKNLESMKQLVNEGKGDELLLGYHFFPITPKRFISLFEPKSNEDVFDYGDSEPKLEIFSKIQMPLFVLLSGSDEAADRPVEEIQKAFDTHAKSKKYKSQIIPDALHRYTGHEPQAVSAIIDWVKSV